MPSAFDPDYAFIAHRRRLPHMRQDDAVYFVTFRLAGSVPQERIRQWQLERELTAHRDADQAENYIQRRIERWLDQGIGTCELERPEATRIVEGSLRYFDGDRYLLDEFVVMPNHVHVVVWPGVGNELSDVVMSWKRYTAREINKLLGQTGALWQHEPFDHIVRDQAHLERIRAYIRDNPAKVPGRHILGGRGKFKGVTGM